MAYRVTADIRYIDGLLADCIIQNGFDAKFASKNRAEAARAMLLGTLNGKTIKAVTGKHYVLVGDVRFTRI